MTEIIDRDPMPQTSGRVFHWAWAYDLLLRILWRGAERTYREKVVELARLRAGESALDVGCGTGTLAIAAKDRAGPMGEVVGIDASPEMIARAEEGGKGCGRCRFSQGDRRGVAVQGRDVRRPCSARRCFTVCRPRRAGDASAR